MTSNMKFPTPICNILSGIGIASRRVCAVLLLATVFAAGAAVAMSPIAHAQSSEAATPATVTSATASASPAQPEGAKQEESADEANKKFLESPTVQALAKLLGLQPGQVSFLSIILNFLILVAILYFGLRKALPTMFRNRTATIQKAMAEAQKASADAHLRLADVESRLATLGQEIIQMTEHAEQAGVAEEQRIKIAAEEDIKKVIEAASQEIASAGRSARRELTAHAADLAVTLAKQRIAATGVDGSADQALVRGFAADLSAADLKSVDVGGKDGK